ncbi:uncharacterized protein [Henckelia pumila]|uniref:uncharacterized protein n=1 Tax=Henckelia pumila TaxID=405737 RepID=UPI003C6E3332
MLHCYGNQIKCKVFLTTLVDSAQSWFDNLEEGSVKTFKEFREVFLQHFSSSKWYKKTTLSLFEIKQLGKESLRAYIQKFNRIALEVPACAPQTKITAFTQRLREGEFFWSLVKRAPQYFEDLLARAKNECWRLIVEPERPIPEEARQVEKKHRGLPCVPRPVIPWINRPDPPKAREVTPWRPDKKPQEGSSKGVINMISGGSTDEDSNRAQKSWSKREIMGVETRRLDPCPVITFGPGDLEEVCLPHNDALLIRARVANYDVRRVFVDFESSVNVIFQEAFEQMELQGCEINPVKMSLYGFAGHTIRPRGEV